MFKLDHIAFSVKDLDVSLSFYALLGFQKIRGWDADDNSLRMALLQNNDNVFIELVYCKSSTPLPEHSQNYKKDLEYIGIKHIALRVKSVEKTLTYLQKKGISKFSDISNKSVIATGKMGRKYFFVNDPDGVILEFVEDE